MQGVKFQFNEQEQHVTISVDVSRLIQPINTDQLLSVFLTTPVIPSPMFHVSSAAILLHFQSNPCPW